jgi:UDP-glucuronate decarboxylase
MQTDDEITGPVNIGNPDEFTILELAQKIMALVGSDSDLEFKALPSDDPSQRQPDISKAKELFGWQPKVSWEEGLLKTIESYRLAYGSILDLR